MDIVRNNTIRCVKEEWAAKIVLFLVWPFGAFLYSLKDMRSRSSFLVFFLYGMLFCWHLNPNHYDKYDDMMGIMGFFYEKSFTLDDIWQQVIGIVTFADDATEKEVYQNFLIWFTKLISDNHHLMFLFASIPYLFFSLKSVRFITSDTKFCNTWLFLSIVLLFVLPRDILTVQNPRFTTGVWMAVYAGRLLRGVWF